MKVRYDVAKREQHSFIATVKKPGELTHTWIGVEAYDAVAVRKHVEALGYKYLGCCFDPEVD